MSDEQYAEDYPEEAYAGADRAAEDADVDAAEDGGEIDGTSEAASDESATDWGYEGKKRRLTREVLVGFAAIAVLVAVFSVVVAKSFFGGDDADEKLAGEPPTSELGDAGEGGVPEADPTGVLPSEQLGPNGEVLSDRNPPSEENFGGEPYPLDAPPDAPWPQDPAPTHQPVASVDPEGLFDPSEPAAGRSWEPGSPSETNVSPEPPSGLFDRPTIASTELPQPGGLPSLDTPAGLPEPLGPEYGTGGLPEPISVSESDSSLTGGTTADPFTRDTPGDPVAGLPSFEPGGINPTDDAGVLPSPEDVLSGLPQPDPGNSLPVYSQPEVTPGDGLPVYESPGPESYAPDPSYVADSAAPLGALPDPELYPAPVGNGVGESTLPALDPGALTDIDSYSPGSPLDSPSTGNGFQSPVVSDPGGYPGGLDPPGVGSSTLVGVQPEITVSPLAGSAQQYTVQSGDSFWTISKKAYGSGRYWQKLAAYNRDTVPHPDRIREGTVVSIPDPAVFGAPAASAPAIAVVAADTIESVENSRRIDSTASSVGAEPSEPGGIFFNEQGYPMYRIGQKDTLTTIAARHLGRASRWKQIYHMNRLQTPDSLQVGTVLKLPADASRVPLIARNTTFR